MKRTRPLSLKECYVILELPKGASLEDVKRAYRRRAFELHPDLNPDNATAAREFQRLNEAYVALVHNLKHEEAREEPRTQQETSSQQDQEPQQETTQATRAKEADTEHGNSTEQESGAQANTHQDTGTHKRAQAAYAQEDVLRDLLNDPFARRVFEDIYSEVNKGVSPPEAVVTATPLPPQPNPTPKPPPKPRKVHMEWGKHKMNIDFTHGVKGMVKGWLRQQIDEQQTFKLPVHSLVPGARIRLQIRRGFSEELHAVEITLPKDFVIGKPVRLRGLGKKIGPWQGDLYLTLEAK